jgi:hypothetical protein
MAAQGARLDAKSGVSAAAAESVAAVHGMAVDAPMAVDGAMDFRPVVMDDVDRSCLLLLIV